MNLMNKLSYLNQAKSWTSESDIDHVIKDLEKNNTYEILEFTGNSLGTVAADALTNPLSFQKNVKILLWNDLFTGRLKTEIGLALKSLSLGLMQAQVNLVEINLCDNAFGPNGVVGVTDLLAHPCCTNLKILNMNNQGLGHQGCKHLVDALKKGREQSNYKGLNLEVFIAGRNRLENAGMKMLLEVFGDGMSSLKKIVLLQNGIGIHGIEGVKNIAAMLKNHKDLEILNLSDNTIKANGTKVLIDLFNDFSLLKELHLDDCLIKDKGARELISYFETNQPQLEYLSLVGNEIKSDCATELVSTILDSLPMLNKIDLRENSVRSTVTKEIKSLASQYGKEDFLVEDSDHDEDDEEDEYEEESESEEESSESTDGEEEDEDEDETCETQYIEEENVSATKPFEFKFNGGDNSFKFNSVDSDIKLTKPVYSKVDLLNILSVESILDINTNSLTIAKSAPSDLFDNEFEQACLSNPEVAVRLAFILANVSSDNVDFAVKILATLLNNSSKWSLATNSILVEMNYIKSEEKKFKLLDINDRVYENVIKSLVDHHELSDMVKMNLKTVLKNLNKNNTNQQRFTSIVDSLEQSLSTLKL